MIIETGQLVSAEELGAIVGLHERQVRKLAERSIIQRDGRGRYDLAGALLAYCAHLREQAAGRAEGGEDGEAPVLAQERALLVRSQREGHELKNQQLRAELIPAGDADEMWGNVLVGVRQKMLALPTKAAPLCIGVQDLGEMREVLTQLVHDALSDLASADVASIADRAGRDGRVGAAPAATTEAATAPDGQPMGG